MGKCIKKLRDYGVKYNPQSQNWAYADSGPNSSGWFLSQNLEDDPELKEAANFMLGEEMVTSMLNKNRQDAIVLGDMVITPRKTGSSGDRFTTYSRAEWTERVEHNLDIYYNNIQEASERMPRLGTMWDGWKLHSSRSYNSLVKAQFSNLDAAHGHVRALEYLGFPGEERLKLSPQVGKFS